MKELTIESLQADHAFHEGIDWITPLLAEGDLEAVKAALCNEKPFWAQWAHANGYSVLPRDAAKRNGAMVAGDRLVFDQTAGHYSTQTAGPFSTQTAGHFSTQTAGDGSTQTAEHGSTQTAGHFSTQTAGDGSTQTAGHHSTQTAGDGSTQTAGHYSTQTAGHHSTQTAGHHSTQTAGDGSTQTAGHGSTQTAGHHSTQTAEFGSRHRATSIPVTFVCRYWINGRYKMNAVVCDGEKLKAQIFYTFDTESETWVEAEDQTERT